MADLYEELAADAAELINEFGREIVVRRPTNVATDASKPWRVAGSSSTDYPVVGVVLPMAATLREGKKLARGDVQVLVASNDLDAGLLETDFIVDGDFTYSVQNVIELRPGATSIIFKAIARLWPPRSSS